MRDYCYFVYNKKRNKRVVITPDAVSVEYTNGGMMNTNICPARLYPGDNRLDKYQRLFIAKNAVEGVYYSPEEMALLRREFGKDFYGL